MILSLPHYLLPSLSIQIIIVVIARLGATFDAKAQFSWVDSSCDSVIDQVNTAGDNYNALVTAAIANLEGGSPTTELGKATLVAYFGTDVGQRINLWYGKLQSAFASQPIALGLYCDGSAFEWVTTYQEGPKEGQALPNGGQWHAQAGRYNPAEGPLYLNGQKTPERSTICQTPQGKNAQGVSGIGGKHIILCPDAFTEPVLGAIPTTKQTLGTSLDDLTSTGAVLLHEATHCILKTTDLIGGYKVGGVLLTAKYSNGAQTNADTWTYYAMASLASNNAWVIGVAQALDNFGPWAPKAPPSPAKRDASPLHVREALLFPKNDPTGLLPLPELPSLEVRAASPETFTVTVTITVNKDCSGSSAGSSTSGGFTSSFSAGTGSTAVDFTSTSSIRNISTSGVSTGSGSFSHGYKGSTSIDARSTSNDRTSTGTTNSSTAMGTASASSGSSGTSISNYNTASGFMTVQSNSGSSTPLIGSGGYLGPVPISAEPASLTAGLTTFTSTTTPTAIEISSSVSSNGHSQETDGIGPFPIFWSHTCWFCPPGLCLFCGIELHLDKGIYPPGSIDPPPGWTGPLPTITIGNDGTPSYDEDEPHETNNNPSNPANSQPGSAVLLSSSSTSFASSGSSSAASPSSTTISSSPTSSASSNSTAFNYIFETPALYSEVSDTVPFSAISAVVAGEFAAYSIDGNLGVLSTSSTASVTSTQNAQAASTAFSSKEASMTPTMTTKSPSTASQTVRTHTGFFCSSSL